jgi:hypothetical protein
LHSPGGKTKNVLLTKDDAGWNADKHPVLQLNQPPGVDKPFKTLGPTVKVVMLLTIKHYGR